MSEELKPCPFCGAELVLTERKIWVHPWNDECPADVIRINTSGIAAWNKRSASRESFDAGWEYHKLLDTSQARLSEAVTVLEPFARYAWSLRGRRDDQHELGWMGTNEEGEPDEVNLTAGDFRAAKAFLATLGEET